ncbi:transglycosylase SLT domain-containing protein [Cribrihabitans sp. XS_ASV171]
MTLKKPFKAAALTAALVSITACSAPSANIIGHAKFDKDGKPTIGVSTEIEIPETHGVKGKFLVEGSVNAAGEKTAEARFTFTFGAKKAGADKETAPGQETHPARKGMAVTSSKSLTDYQQATLATVAEVAIEEGIDLLDFVAIATIESNLNAKAKNPYSTASGVMQFIASTAKAYGLRDVFDAQANAQAGAHLLKDNATYLEKKLGRPPTGSELYLAHQQGAGNAAKLILGGDKLASEVTGRQAINLNLPKGAPKNPTAAQFVSAWDAKFQAARAQYEIVK